MACPITVGFDARLLAHETQPTGVGRYARELLRALDAQPDVRMTLYTDRPIMERPWSTHSRLVGSIKPLPWQQTALPWALWRDKPAVYHSPTFTLPLTASVPLVVTVHDLGMFRYPQHADPANLEYLSKLMPRSLKRADAIITVSHHVKNELIEDFGVPGDKIHPIWLGVDTERWQKRCREEIAATVAKYHIASPYILFVGTREPRKNLKRLVQAFSLASPRLQDTHLILIGPQGFEGPYTEELEVLIQNTAHVQVLPFVNDRDLPLLVQGAALLCYVSEYEGFGLPVLEAMAVGTPVLTSRNTVMEEVAQKFAYYTDPLDADAMAFSIVKALTTQQSSALVEGATKHAQTFSWQDTAEKTVRVYTRVAQRC